MSDLQFHSRSDPKHHIRPRSAATPGTWLIMAGIALAVIVLALVLGAPPSDQAAPTADLPSATAPVVPSN